jgi:hypothetical protein
MNHSLDDWRTNRTRSYKYFRIPTMCFGISMLRFSSSHEGYESVSRNEEFGDFTGKRFIAKRRNHRLQTYHSFPLSALKRPGWPCCSRPELSRSIDVEDKMNAKNTTNRTEPRTVGQWIRYVVVAPIALFLVWWMLRLYVL